MTKPRVLFVGPTRYPEVLPDGLQRKFDALERQLEFRVLARAEGAARSNGRFVLIRPVRPAALEGAIFRTLLAGHVARAIRDFRPDVVVAEDPPSAAAALLGRRLARTGDCPRVVTEVHGDWRASTRLYGSPARRLLAPLADAVDSYAVRRADATRALSPYTARLVEQKRGIGPDAVFPTFTDLAAFEGPRLPLPAQPAALFVGVLERYKGIDTVAAAWPRVADAVPGARLVVVGQGSRAALVRRLGAQYAPKLAPAEVAARMDDAWVLVLPSRYEGLGRVVIESFARGRGVIGGRAGGILDLVQDEREGLLVDPGDAAALARALTRVLSDRSLADRLGSAAGAAYERWRSTPEDFAASVRALVERAIGGGRSS